jgi:hypothetical protein
MKRNAGAVRLRRFLLSIIYTHSQSGTEDYESLGNPDASDNDSIFNRACGNVEFRLETDKRLLILWFFTPFSLSIIANLMYQNRDFGHFTALVEPEKLRNRLMFLSGCTSTKPASPPQRSAGSSSNWNDKKVGAVRSTFNLAAVTRIVAPSFLSSIQEPAKGKAKPQQARSFQYFEFQRLSDTDDNEDHCLLEAEYSRAWEVLWLQAMRLSHSHVDNEGSLNARINAIRAYGQKMPPFSRRYGDDRPEIAENLDLDAAFAWELISKKPT